MIDPELKKILEYIGSNIEGTRKAVTHSSIKAMFNGVLSGFGSVIGVAIAIALIGWLLNIVGIIPAFKNQVKQWQQLIEQTNQRQNPAIKK